MSSVAIVTASTSSLPADFITRYNIHLLRFVIQFLDGNYREGEEFGLTEFYRRLERSDAVPTTAPTSVAQFIQLFSREFPAAETVVVFHVSAKTSKSFEYAEQAAERIKDRRIVNIDTNSTAAGSGLQVIAFAQALEQGQALDAALEQAQRLRNQTFSAALPESIRYLRMSGRLGRLPAMAASLMGILPIIGHTEEGMEALAKPRSLEAGQKKLVELMQVFLGSAQPHSLGISHTNAPDKAQALREMVEPLYPHTPLYVADAGPILAVHVGPGTVNLAALRTSS